MINTNLFNLFFSLFIWDKSGFSYYFYGFIIYNKSFLNILKVEKINCEFDFEKKLNSHLFLEKIVYILHFPIQNFGYDQTEYY